MSSYSGQNRDERGWRATVLVVTPHPSGAVAASHLTHHVHHSPDGFAWGYGGSGPSELARCILWDHTGAEPHPATYQAFKEDWIVPLPAEGSWTIDGADIAKWLAERELAKVEVDQRFAALTEAEESAP